VFLEIAPTIRFTLRRVVRFGVLANPGENLPGGLVFTCLSTTTSALLKQSKTREIIDAHSCLAQGVLSK
jgi:hypothetical protein